MREPDRTPLIVARPDTKPPRLWHVDSLRYLLAEQSKVLKNEQQREHVKEQVLLLSSCSDPSTPSNVLDIKRYEDIFYLRDWNGILHGINLRLFFGVYPRDKTIVLLGLIDKKSQKLSDVAKITMARRWRQAKEGLDVEHATRR